MIKGKRVLSLDGNFRKQHPIPEKVSHREGAQWFVTERGPRYSNVIRVTEFDEAGLEWLIAHELPASD
jgi:hypothetical protein